METVKTIVISTNLTHVSVETYNSNCSWCIDSSGTATHSPSRVNESINLLASFFNDDDFEFSITSSTAPGAVRSYHSFSQAAKEVADALRAVRNDSS
jgi:hypothetical protein